MTQVRFLFFLLNCAVVVLVLSSCTSKHIPVHERVRSAEAITPVDAPFEVFIEDEFFDGQTLAVAFIIQRVSSEINEGFDEALILLRSMDGEQVIDRAVFSFTETDLRDAPGQTLERVLQVRSEDVEDYQVEVLWGSDVEERRVGLNREAIQLESLTVDPIGFPCRGEPCELTFRVEALLVNRSEHPVDSIILGVKYLAPEELDGGDVSFDDQEQLSLEGLRLAPGQNQPLRLILEDPLSIDRYDAGVRPAIKIKEFRVLDQS